MSENTVKDKLDVIFELQGLLDDDITLRRGLGGISSEEWIQKDVLALVSELGELLCEVNFKWWKNPKEIDSAAIKEEIVDVVHFVISMARRAGMTSDELYEGYIAKNKENFDRQYDRSKKEGYELTE